jgi:hypothetical protein
VRGLTNAGRQEKIKECQSVEMYRKARVKKLKSAWNQERRNSRMHECNRRRNARVKKS